MSLSARKVLVFDKVELELTTAHPTVSAVPGTASVPEVDSETSKANVSHYSRILEAEA